MPCYAIDGVIPVVSPQAYVHPTAVLIGDVIIEEGAYIGPFAILHGCVIRKNVLVGMNSVILDEAEIEWKIKGTEQYIQLTQRCLSSMHEVLPFLEDSAERLTYKNFNATHVLKNTDFNLAN